MKKIKPQEGARQKTNHSPQKSPNISQLVVDGVVPYKSLRTTGQAHNFPHSADKQKTQEELSYGNEMFQKGYKAGFDRGKSEARKEFLEIIDEEIKDEENAKKRNAVRNWYWDDELRLLKQKIKELQNSGAKDEK